MAIRSFLLFFSILLHLANSLPAVTVESNDEKPVAVFNPDTDDDVPLNRYLTHDEMTTWLHGMARRYPKLIKVTSIGKSLENRDLWVLELSHSVGRGKRDLLMPMIKLVIKIIAL